MKKVVLVVVAALVLSCVAMADIVTFSTSGNFVAGGTATGGGSSITWGSGGNTLSLSFAGAPSNSYNTPFAGASLGTFTTATAGSGNVADASGSLFTLTVTQTQPGPTGSQAFTGSITGNVIWTAGSPTGPGQLEVVYNQNFVTINGISYKMNNVTADGSGHFIEVITLPNTSPDSAPTTVSANIVTPEPGALLLFGTGLTGLGTMIRRRKKS